MPTTDKNELWIAGVGFVALSVVIGLGVAALDLTRLTHAVIGYGMFASLSSYMFLNILHHSSLSETKERSDPDFLADRFVFAGLIIVPILTALVGHHLDDLPTGATDLGRFVAILLFLVYCCLVCIVTWMIRGGHTASQWVLVPTALISLLLFSGGPRGAGFLTEVLPIHTLEVGWWARVTLYVILPFAFILDVFVAMVRERGIFKVIARTYASGSRPNTLAHGLQKVSQAIGLFIGTIVRFGKMAGLIIWTLVKVTTLAIITSVRELVKIKRVVIVALASSLMLVGLALQAGAGTFPTLLFAWVRADINEVEILWRICVWMAWLTAFAAAYSAIGFRQTSEVPSTCMMVWSLFAGGAWGAYVVGIFIGTTLAADVLGLSVTSPFFITIAVLLVWGVFVDRGRSFRLAATGVVDSGDHVAARAPDDGARGPRSNSQPTRLAWYKVGSGAVIAVVFFFAVVWAITDPQGSERGTPSSPADAIPLAPATSPKLQLQAPVPESRVDWLSGAWGANGDCAARFLIQESEGTLTIEFAGAVHRRQIVKADENEVRTNVGTYRRTGAKVVATEPGLERLELERCG